MSDKPKKIIAIDIGKLEEMKRENWIDGSYVQALSDIKSAGQEITEEMIEKHISKLRNEATQKDFWAESTEEAAQSIFSMLGGEII